MALYLLDTNVVIDVLKGITATTLMLDQLISRGDLLCTCSIVIAEVNTGLHPQDRAKGDTFIETLVFLSSTADAGRQAGLWRYQYARQGIQIAITDALIAATALEYDAVLVTRNTRHFPMPGIRLLPPASQAPQP